MPSFDEARVKQTIAIVLIDCDLDEVVPSAKLTDDLNADSLDVAELKVKLELEFDIDITEGEFEKIKTVQDVISLVRQKVA